MVDTERSSASEKTSYLVRLSDVLATALPGSDPSQVRAGLHVRHRQGAACLQ
jgi:hypothetical protein